MIKSVKWMTLITLQKCIFWLYCDGSIGCNKFNKHHQCLTKRSAATQAWQWLSHVAKELKEQFLSSLLYPNLLCS